MTMKKLLSVLLAAVMLLTLCACGKADDYTSPDGDADASADAPQLSDAVGRVVISADAEFQVAYDENGNAVGVINQNALAEAVADSYSDFAGKSCPQVVRELIDAVFEQNTVIDRGYVLIQLELGSALPSDSFLADVADEARLNKGAYGVVAVSAADLDADGRFNKATVLAILEAFLGGTEGLTVTCAEAPADGSYSITCTDSSSQSTDYYVHTQTGAVVLADGAEQTEAQDPDAAQDIPESDIFDPISDIDAAAGADGGVDSGTV